MAIWLNTIPPISTKIIYPHFRRWIIILAIFLIIGALLTLWLWTQEYSGFQFWFTLIGLPFCIWGLCFGLRYMAYKIDQIAANTWDNERDILILAEIKRGQRFAYLLDIQIETPAGKSINRAINAIEKAVPFILLQSNRVNNQKIRYAALPLCPQTDIDKILTHTLCILSQQITLTLNKIPVHIPCYYLIEIESSFQQLAETILLQTLAKENARTFYLLSGSGMEAIDIWLDKRWETPSLLLIVAIRYLSNPSNNDGEALASILLSNRSFADFNSLPRLHRPEKSRLTHLPEGLAHTLQWGNIDIKNISGSWLAGPQLINTSAWDLACESHHLPFNMVTKNKIIDPIFGNIGKVVPWVGIALAVNQLNKNIGEDAQLIATQSQDNNEDIWIALVSHHRENKETIVYAKN